MIVDSSALVAIVRREQGYEPVLERLAGAPWSGIGTPTLVEAGVVLESRLGVRGRTLLTRLVDDVGVAAVPFESEHARVALDAFARYGRGRHPAGLNYGDCLTYATARVAREPLLCLGDDFAATDLELVR